MLPGKHLKLCQASFGDITRTIELDMWENHIAEFELGHCYSISPVHACSWIWKKKHQQW